jgi:Tn3 transposase DDE domain
LAVDAAVRFSWIMLGREPRSSKELLMVYAGILAHGTALSAAETARMIPQLSSASVRQAMKWASDERRLAQACSAVLAFMHRHPISMTWGRSDLASSDMMSMETSQRVFVARNDPRRLTPSVGIYSHTRDRWCEFSFIVGVERKWGRGPLNSPHAQIRTEHEIADSRRGRRRSRCRSAARRALVADNVPPVDSSASAASCSIDD